MVELALVIPILLMLVFGIIEFGRIFGADLLVRYSAREGARVGAIGGSNANIISQIQDSAVTLDPAKLNISIAPPEASRSRGAQLTVQVAYPIEIIMPFLPVVTGDTVTVRTTCVMRIE